LRYPPEWTEVVSEPAGFHGLASRPGMKNGRDIGVDDIWFVAEAFLPHPVIGCGEPRSYIEKADVQLGGQPASRFLRRGLQADANATVINVIAVRGGVCYTFVLTAGDSVPMDQAMRTAQMIQSGYLFTN
jgi:hypothetical protein